MAYELKDGDIAVVISPDLDENGAWTGTRERVPDRAPSA